MTESTGWGKREQAREVAALLEPGWVVNVGVGMPVLVPSEVNPADGVVFHCENGLIGYRTLREEEQPDPDIIDARCEPIQLVAGASVVAHDISFGIARGGRLDATVLGAFQVAANGDLANWSVGGGRVAGIGGAMDLAVGARRVIVMLKHNDRSGNPKIVERCTLPLTAVGCVTAIVSELAVFDVTPNGLLAVKLAPGVDAGYVKAHTGAPLRFAANAAPGG
ncbi:MAG: 3-oxoadipate CoA-transferase [Bifidobacteriaceae bacterium]|jgi:3-oxoacid CoA-transferase B subunit|nr:3-oxoadipate CoA-transferase [Bifidobacteriaceae bacterium]